MTTISTYLAASLVAVTFGWVPSERANESQPSEGYDYLVKLSPEDLEALRDGRAIDLVSELPDDLQPIERVRVYVGQGEAPQQLRERDRLSPQRIIAAESTAKPYTVAKPVTPEWKDAATLEADEANESDTAERRTSYQNPNALQQGFEQATRPLNDVGQAIDTQAKNLADGTAQLFQQGGDQIRRGAQDLLNGGSRALESLVPNSSAAPYANRPQYDQPSLVTPPETSGGASAPQQAQFTSPSYPNQNYPQQAYPPAYQNNQPQSSLSSPPLANSYDRPAQANNSLVESYAREADPYDATTRRVLAPVPRNDGTAATDFNSSLPPSSSSQQNPWDPNYNASGSSLASQASSSPGTPRTNSSFPEQSAPTNSGSSSSLFNGSSWPDDFGSSARNQSGAQTGGGFANDRTPLNTTPVANNGGASNTGWNGGEIAGSNLGGQNPAAPPAANRSDDSLFINHLLMVLLGAATCWTWIAYIDVRNKYLSVLRAAPGSGYSNAA